ncbi:leukocyte antigen CD37-like [Anser cygnoides]|uniref:leukocyte antigen CD37-like n=1 Tax=Anser cygnoides TaxID=8845 RepID=UPI0034D1E047
MSPKRWLGAARCFLCSFNLLVFALGSLLLVFSLWMLLDRHSFAAALGSPLLGLRLGAYVCCGLGAACALLGAWGAWAPSGGCGCCWGCISGSCCCSSWPRSRSGSSPTRSAWPWPPGWPPTRGTCSAPTRPGGARGAAHESWDALQQQLGCCGWSGPRDWDTLGAPPGTVACSCLAPPAPNGTQGTPPGPPTAAAPRPAPGGFSPGAVRRAPGAGWPRTSWASWGRPGPGAAGAVPAAARHVPAAGPGPGLGVLTGPAPPMGSEGGNSWRPAPPIKGEGGNSWRPAPPIKGEGGNGWRPAPPIKGEGGNSWRPAPPIKSEGGNGWRLAPPLFPSPSRIGV